MFTHLPKAPLPPPQVALATHNNLLLRDSYDAHVLFQAVRQGHLPLIRKHLTGPEQQSLHAGQVFVWAEREGGLERWTDGHNWSPSRIRGPFLMYDEMPEDTDAFLRRKQQQKNGERRAKQTRKKRLPPLPGGLSKQTYSATLVQQGMDIQKWHLTAYFKDDGSNNLLTVDNDLLLRTIIVPDSTFKSSMSRKSKNSFSRRRGSLYEQRSDADAQSECDERIRESPMVEYPSTRSNTLPWASPPLNPVLSSAFDFKGTGPVPSLPWDLQHPKGSSSFTDDPYGGSGSSNGSAGPVHGADSRMHTSLSGRQSHYTPYTFPADTFVSGRGRNMQLEAIHTHYESTHPSLGFSSTLSPPTGVPEVFPPSRSQSLNGLPSSAITDWKPFGPDQFPSPYGSSSPAHLGRRRYSRTSISSMSSTESITSPTAPNASAFRVDFSSSSSEEGLAMSQKGPPRLLPGHKNDTPIIKEPSHLSPAQASNMDFISRAMSAPARFSTRREVKQLFGRLTPDVSPQTTDSQLTARLQYAHRLVEIMDQGDASLQIVLQRFTKTSDRLAKGFTALLSLSDVEPSDGLELSPMSPTARLLTLLTSEVNVYHRLFPSFIHGDSRGAAGIRYMIRSYADKYWSPAESKDITSFAARIVQEQAPGSRPWLQGLSLLEQLMRGDVLAASGSLSLLPEGTLIGSFQKAFEAALGVRTSWTSSNIASSRIEPGYQTLWTFFQLVRSSSTRIIPIYESPVHYAVANSNQLPTFLAKTIITTPSASSPLVSFARCLALAALTSIVQLKQANDRLFPKPELKEALFETCFDVMLGRTGWQYEGRSEVERTRIPKLFPHEDAYDIVRIIYLPLISGAAAGLLTKLAAEEDPYEKLKVLEPLLWLSRMPHHDVKIAILEGGVIPFLKAIVDMDFPEQNHPHYRIIVRSKGDALTCFGNFFEDMSAETSFMFVYPDMHETAQTITLDENMPRMLRGQAAFAMERYSHAHEAQH